MNTKPTPQYALRRQRRWSMLLGLGAAFCTTLGAGMIVYQLVSDPPELLAQFLRKEGISSAADGVANLQDQQPPNPAQPVESLAGAAPTDLHPEAQEPEAQETTSTPMESGAQEPDVDDSETKVIESNDPQTDAPQTNDPQTDGTDVVRDENTDDPTENDQIATTTTLDAPFDLFSKEQELDSSKRPATAVPQDSSVDASPAAPSASATHRVGLAYLFDEGAVLAIRNDVGRQSSHLSEHLSAEGAGAWEALRVADYPQQLHGNATALVRYLDDAWALNEGDAQHVHDQSQREAFEKLVSRALLQRWQLLSDIAGPVAQLSLESHVALKSTPLANHYPLLRDKLVRFYGAPLDQLYVDNLGRVLIETMVREGVDGSSEPNPLPRQIFWGK